MSKEYNLIDTNTGTFAGWLTQSNDLFEDMTNIIVTVSNTATYANLTNNSTTSGNGHIEGAFSAVDMVIKTSIHGGDATNTTDGFDHKATLFVTSNVTIGTSGTPENLIVWGNSTLKDDVTIGTGIDDALLIEANTNINGQVYFHANAQFDDSDYLKFGTSGDVSVQWNATNLYTKFEVSNASFIIEDSSGNDIVDIDIDSSTLTIARYDDESEGPSLVLLDEGTTSDNNAVGSIFFKGQDDTSDIKEYAAIKGIAEDNTKGTEDGSLTLYATIANTSVAMIAINEDADTEVSLRHNGSEKLQTQSWGVDITGELQADSLDVDGVWDITGVGGLHANTQWDDGARLKIGTGADLQIYHDGSHSYVTDAGTGNLKIAASQIDFLGGADGAETMATMVDNGAVTLYYDNSAKLATTSSGVSITGGLSATSLTATGLLTVNSLDVTTGTVVGGDLTVQGALVATGSSEMTVNNATMTTLTVIGDTELGDSGSDTLTISATVSANSDIVPAIDSTYDLGSNTYRYALAYVDDLTLTANINLQTRGSALFYDADNTNYVAFKAPATVATNVVWTLPASDTATSGYSLQSNGSGVLSWGPAGATTTADEATAAERYLYFSSITSGAVTAVNHDTGLRYNPSLGRITTASANVVTLSLSGTAVTSTATELNLLDGVTSTTSELNIVDGDTSASSITSVGTDKVVYNDAGVMKQVTLATLDTYFSGTTKTLTNKTLTSPSIGTNFTFDSVTVTGIQTSGESFVDDNVSLMTSAAIADKAQAIVDADATILRSNAADTKTSGDLTFNDNIAVNLGTGEDVEIYHNGTNTYVDINAGTLNVRNVTTDAFTFTPSSGSLELRNSSGAGDGPVLALRHDTASPAAADEVGIIYFQGDDSGGTNMNYATIIGRIVDPTDTSEDSSVQIYTYAAGSNTLHFSANSGVTTLYHNGSAKIATNSGGVTITGTATATTFAGNATTASAWQTARTLTLSGAVTGSASIDGSGNVTLATTATSDPTLTLAGDATGSATFTNLGNATLTVAVVNDSHTHDGRYYTESESDARFLGITAKAADSNLLDGIDSGSFLRSDATDIKNAGTLTFNDNIRAYFGTGNDSSFFFNGTHTFFEAGATGGNFYFDMYGSNDDIIFRDGTSTRFQFDITNGNFEASGNVTAYSDRRIKENIEIIPNAIEKVKKINGYTYNRTDIETDKRQTGVIAQEVLEVLPEVVVYNKEEDRYTVAYGNMVGLLIEAIKELKAEIDELKGKK